MVEGKKKVKNIKEQRRESVDEVSISSSSPKHRGVDRSTQLKRQNSATKIQAMARMVEGKKKVRDIKDQRKSGRRASTTY